MIKEEITKLIKFFLICSALCFYILAFIGWLISK